jgi:hypothetical protein
MAAATLVGLAQVGWAQPPAQVGPPLPKLLIGQWYGQGGCDGDLLLRADRTFELKDYGPATSDRAGVWTLRGQGLPATLELTFKSSDVREDVGTTMRVQITKLDDKNLTIEYAQPNGSPSGRYSRVRK